MTSHANSLLSHVSFTSSSHKHVLTAAVRMAMMSHPKASQSDVNDTESQRKSSASSLGSAFDKINKTEEVDITSPIQSLDHVIDDVTPASRSVTSSPVDKTFDSSDDSSSICTEK